MSFNLTIDQSVPEVSFKLPAPGTYRMNVVKAEEKTSASGKTMIALEMKIPSDDASLQEQGINFPVTIFDNLIVCDAQGCISKINSFLRALKVNNLTDLSTLVGKSFEAVIKLEKNEQYGDRMVVSRYVKDSVAEAFTGQF